MTQDNTIQWRRTKWREALESDEYEQGRGLLRTGELWCCLGVACDVYKKLTGNGRWVKTREFDVNMVSNPLGITRRSIYAFVPSGTRRTREDDTSQLPREVAEFFNTTKDGHLNSSVTLRNKNSDERTGKSLMELNDHRVSFKEIAKLVTNYQDDFKSFLEAYK